MSIKISKQSKNIINISKEKNAFEVYNLNAIMEIVIKCENKINPAAADSDNVWFSAVVSGGIADGFVFSISKAGGIIYKKEIKGGYFPVLRPGIGFSENTKYHYEAIAYLGENEVARSSGEFVTAFTPRKAKWVKAKTDDDFILVFSKSFDVKKKRRKLPRVYMRTRFLRSILERGEENRRVFPSACFRLFGKEKRR